MTAVPNRYRAISASSLGRELLYCKECGGLVIDQDRHHDWHGALKNVAAEVDRLMRTDEKRRRWFRRATR